MERELPEAILVEVVFATPDRQEIISVELAASACVSDAIDSSGIQMRFSESLDDYETGIWGKVVPRDHVLADGDRVEIYRKLARDPKDARRELARAQRSGSSS
jgi:putative ubiquitin-RnfH superfamily antitoxin RatB of RatAB toxin-antitoxin module